VGIIHGSGSRLKNSPPPPLIVAFSAKKKGARTFFRTPSLNAMIGIYYSIAAVSLISHLLFQFLIKPGLG
jgi:hypothetical protein